MEIIFIFCEPSSQTFVLFYLIIFKVITLTSISNLYKSCNFVINKKVETSLSLLCGLFKIYFNAFNKSIIRVFNKATRKEVYVSIFYFIG